MIKHWDEKLEVAFTTGQKIEQFVHESHWNQNSLTTLRGLCSRLWLTNAKKLFKRVLLKVLMMQMQA